MELPRGQNLGYLGVLIFERFQPKVMIARPASLRLALFCRHKAPINDFQCAKKYNRRAANDFRCGLAVGLDQNFTKSTENASNFSLSPEKRDFRTLRKSEICENMRKCDQMGELGTEGRVRI